MLGAHNEPAIAATATSKHDRNALKCNDSSDSSPVYRRRPVTRVPPSSDDAPLVNPHVSTGVCADDFNSPPPKVPQPIASIRKVLQLPLNPAMSVSEMEDELAAKRSDFESKKAAGAGREVLNPIGYHIAWLEKFVKLSATTSLPTFVEGEIWVARLGDVAVVGSPGELFTATIFAGYCQGVLGYISTRAEYPYGGYEPTVAQRGYGHPAPFAPEAGEMIAAESIALLNQLFKVNN